MKKMLVLLLALSSGALYGVCACQLNKPRPQTTQKPTQKPQAAKAVEEKEAPAQHNAQDAKVADKA